MYVYVYAPRTTYTTVYSVAIILKLKLLNSFIIYNLIVIIDIDSTRLACVRYKHMHMLVYSTLYTALMAALFVCG